MKIALTGASGFIGSNFLTKFSHHFEKVTFLKRNLNLEEVVSQTRDIETLIHLAYDRFNLLQNLTLLDVLLEACLQNNIKRFVFLSSFSVYDPFLKGVVNEKSVYSKLDDHYSFIKISLEKKLVTFSKNEGSPQIIILQPTVVYGRGGNWYYHAIKSTVCGVLKLPHHGNGLCNVVSVQDVSAAIYQSIYTQLDFTNTNQVLSFIISEAKSISWADFYTAHARLKNINMPLIESAKRGTYSANFFKNLLYHFLFSRMGVRSILLVSSFVFKHKLKKANTEDDALQEGAGLAYFEPEGISRVVHSSEFTMDASKSVSQLHLKYSNFQDSFFQACN